MVEHTENQENDHEYQRSGSGLNTEEANKANDRKVATDQDVLQSAGIDEAFGVDVPSIDVKKVVPVGKVEEVEANCCKSEDQRRNA